MRHLARWSALLVIVGMLCPARPAAAQGVTTGVMAGVVTDTQKQPVVGAQVIAIHLPSGTTYEGTSRADGRFSSPGMRVGGPYTVFIEAAREHGTNQSIRKQVNLSDPPFSEGLRGNVEIRSASIEYRRKAPAQ